MMRDWVYAGAFTVVSGVTMVSPGAVFADSAFDRVPAEAEFVDLIAGKSLTRLGIRLDVARDGLITGKAFGREVMGNWSWENGLFCRTLNFGSQTLERNCQVVKVRGETLRFIADEGAGDIADLRLR